MTVETYLQRAFALYVHSYDSPDPLINRLNAFDQAFMSSCFEWYDGYLLEGSDELRGKSKPKPYGAKWVPNKREQRRLDNNVQVLAGREERAENRRIVNTLRNHPLDETVWKPRSCYFETLQHIPDDIRPDWLAAVIEYLDAVDAFYSDPEKYKHDFFYPSDARLQDAERQQQRKQERKTGIKADTLDLDTDEGMEAFLNEVLSDAKKPEVAYVPDPVLKEKLTQQFEKELKKRLKFNAKVRARIAVITAARA